MDLVDRIFELDVVSIEKEVLCSNTRFDHKNCGYFFHHFISLRLDCAFVNLKIMNRDKMFYIMLLPHFKFI